MKAYPISQELTFIILALISALALLGRHAIVATLFFAISLLFIWYEHRVYEYIKTA